MSTKLVGPRKTGPSHTLLFQEDPILVSTPEEFLYIKKNFKRNQKIKFLCPCCKKETIKQVRTIESLQFKCTSCAITEAANDPKKIEKRKQTKLERYGDENYSNQEKRKQTILDKYGSFTVLIEKALKTKNKNKLENPDYTTEINNKRTTTIIEHYGSWENYNKQRSVKSRQTKKEKYGNETWNNQEKRQNTILNNNSNCFTKRLLYNDIYFDSNWELLFYVYHKDNNLYIERNIHFYYEYTDEAGKNHKYFPDFKVQDGYVEIKGDQFFKDSYKENLRGESWEAKYKCILDNNIKLLRQRDLKDIFKACANKYSGGSVKRLFNEWCKQFRVK